MDDRLILELVFAYLFTGFAFSFRKYNFLKKNFKEMYERALKSNPELSEEDYINQLQASALLELYIWPVNVVNGTF